MVEQGYRCPVCGGEIELVPQEPAVVVASDRDGAPRDDSPGRRFER